jgi:hypothetical protein
VIVKDISSDEHEVHAELGSLLAQLLKRSEPGLAKPVAGILIKPRDTQTKVQVRGMQKANHGGASAWSR